jgi:copper chaperone CopZ
MTEPTMTTTATDNTSTYPLTGLHCQACVGRISRALAPLADSVTVSLLPMQVVVQGPHASQAELALAVAQAGAYLLGEPAMAVPNDSKSRADAVPAAASATPTTPNTPLTQRPAELVPSFFTTYRPLLLLLGFIAAASVLAQTAHGSVTTAETMRLFMAGFFLAFSFFKLLDLQAFATAYAGYDLLAARWPAWGFIYPFVELGLGLAYLSHAAPMLTHSVTLAVMGFSALGVIQAVTQKRQIQCACLGAVFKLPMSTVTIVEDLGMFAMAAWMLAT